MTWDVAAAGQAMRPLSAWIFGEYFTTDAPRLALGSLAFVSMCAAVVVLTRTTPATMSLSATAAGAPAVS